MLPNGRPKTDRQGYVVQSARLANQLRFKVARNTQGKFVALAYHLPCKLPAELLQALSPQEREWIAGKQLEVWRSVHEVLDRQMQRTA